MKNQIVYKTLTIVWTIFGLIFLFIPLVLGGSLRSILLSYIVALLFLINAYLNWKKFLKTKEVE
jgi:hypothetical protein